MVGTSDRFLKWPLSMDPRRAPDFSRDTQRADPRCSQPLKLRRPAPGAGHAMRSCGINAIIHYDPIRNHGNIVVHNGIMMINGIIMWYIYTYNIYIYIWDRIIMVNNEIVIG